MQKVEIAEATADQLRQFGETFLGLEVRGNESRDVMRARFQEAGYTLDFIQIQDPNEVAAPSNGTLRDGAPLVSRVNDRGVKEVRITVHVQDRPGGDDPVPVGVNGRVMLIPRGKPVFVPEAYVEALNNAEEFVYTEYDPESDSGLGGLAAPRTVKSYPFSYA